MPNSFMPSQDDALVVWFKKFVAGLDANKNKAGITGADVTATQADAAALEFAVNFQAQMQARAEAFTAYKDALRDGLPQGSTDDPLALPPLAAYGAAPDGPPAAVRAGVGRRALDLAARIKRAPGYDDALGQALGIVAPEKAVARPEDMKPPLRSDGDNAGHPVLRCSRGAAELIEVEGDHADTKGWVHVATTRRTRFTDMFALPPAGTAQVWRYRAIYRDANGRIGQWSDVISVTVAGA